MALDLYGGGWVTGRPTVIALIAGIYSTQDGFPIKDLGNDDFLTGCFFRFYSAMAETCR